MSSKRSQYRVSTVPLLIKETENVFIGCEIHGQRFEVSVCDSRRCKHRKKCRQYQAAIRMKQDIEDERPKRQRKRKTEDSANNHRKRRKRTSETVESRTKSSKRRRKSKKDVDVETTTKRQRRRKPTKRRRKRESK